MNDTTRPSDKSRWSGLLLIAIGVAVAIHARSLEVGTLSRMGPGYFPLVLGIILAVVGAVILVQGLRDRTGAPPAATIVSSSVVAAPVAARQRPEWKAWFLICLSLVAFVFLAQHLGLVVATFAIVFVSALADRENSVATAALLALAMVVVAVVVFWWALQIQLPLFRLA